MSFTFTADFTQWQAAAMKAAGPVTQDDIARLSQVLEVAFEDTQQIVHVITGSLQASGKKEEVVEAESWVGRIGYGGSSDGAPHDPVKYAIDEMDRGGSHDFLSPLHQGTYNEQFLDAMTERWRG